MNASNSDFSQPGWELKVVGSAAFPAVLYLLMLSAVLVANSVAKRRGCEDIVPALGSQHAQIVVVATPIVVGLASAGLSLPVGFLFQICVTVTPLVFIFASLGLVPDRATTQNLAPPNARRLFHMLTVLVATIIVFTMAVWHGNPDTGSTFMTLATDWAAGALSLASNLVTKSGERGASTRTLQAGIATAVVTCVLSRAWHKNFVVPRAVRTGSAEVRSTQLVRVLLVVWCGGGGAMQRGAP